MLLIIFLDPLKFLIAGPVLGVGFAAYVSVMPVLLLSWVGSSVHPVQPVLVGL